MGKANDCRSPPSTTINTSFQIWVGLQHFKMSIFFLLVNIPCIFQAWVPVPPDPPPNSLEETSWYRWADKAGGQRIWNLCGSTISRNQLYLAYLWQAQWWSVNTDLRNAPPFTAALMITRLRIDSLHIEGFFNMRGFGRTGPDMVLCASVRA